MVELQGTTAKMVIEYQYRRQRIVCTLSGESSGAPQDAGRLMEVVDYELARAASRALIGWPIVDKAAQSSMDDFAIRPKQPLSEQWLKLFLANTKVNFTLKANCDNTTILNSVIEGSNVGDDGSNQSDNNDSLNH